MGEAKGSEEDESVEPEVAEEKDAADAGDRQARGGRVADRNRPLAEEADGGGGKDRRQHREVVDVEAERETEVVGNLAPAQLEEPPRHRKLGDPIHVIPARVHIYSVMSS